MEVSPPTIERVIFIIANHHSYPEIDDIDFQILVEADLLVNIYEKKMEKNVTNRLYKQFFKTNAGKKLVETLYL